MSETSNVDSGEQNYGYIPTKIITIIFVVLYSITTLLHGFQSIKSRMWYLIPTIGLCGILEIIGWSARLWSSITPTADTAFALSISTIVLAPTPLIAANFVILGKIIERLGSDYSRLKPRLYTIVFCTADVFSLLVQSTGGGLAASATSNHTDPALGGNITLAGIIFQTVMITVYMICATEFFVRYFRDTPVRHDTSFRGIFDRDMLVMSSALVFSTICLYIRAVYRTVELGDGWDGRIFRTELYFNVLDGAMVVLAMYTLNIAHPGGLLNDGTSSSGKIEYMTMNKRLGRARAEYSESSRALA